MDSQTVFTVYIKMDTFILLSVTLRKRIDYSEENMLRGGGTGLKIQKENLKTRGKPK